MDLFNRFSDVRILVAGDLMLDKYWWGTVDRISPEAPVPIVRLNRTSTVVGGCGKCSCKCSVTWRQSLALGAIGKDRSGVELCELLQAPV